MAGVHVALTGGELTAIAGPHTCRTYLYAIQGTATATARINGTPITFPLGSLTVGTVSGNWSSVAAGMTVAIGQMAGAADRGLYRVRLAGNSTTLNVMEISNADAGLVPQTMRSGGILDGDYVTVYLTRRDAWAIAPLIQYPGTGTAATTVEDYAQAVGTSNTTPGPLVNMGDNLLLFVDSGQAYATYTFVTAGAVWPTSASISSYAHTVDASWTVTGGALNTATFTAQIPVGEYTYTCLVTDNNGATFTGTRIVVVQNRSGANSPIPIASFSDTADRLGWTATLDINDNNLASIPDGAMVLIKQEVTFGGSTTVTAWQNLVGWVLRQTETSGSGLRSATLEIVGPAGIMARLPGYSQYFEVASSPSTWQQIVSALAYIDFVLAWMILHRAKNLMELFDYTKLGIANTSGRLPAWKIQGQTLLGQVQDIAQAYAANFGCNPNGEMFVRPHPSRMDLGARTAIVRRLTLTSSMIHDMNPVREMRAATRTVWGEAFAYDGAAVVPLKSVAPGNSPGQGISEDRLERQIADSQSDLDVRTGRDYAIRNNPYPSIPMRLQGNFGALIYPAEMQYVPLNVGAAYRPTATAFTPKTIPVRVRRTFSAGGVVDTDLELEGEVDGAAGVYVPIPSQSASQLYGPFSVQPPNPLPGKWGGGTTNTPITGTGLLLATADGYVVRGKTWTKISPSAAQRAALGTAIKLLADPWQYKRLILFGSAGAAITDDSTVAVPIWRLVNLASSSGASWSQTFDFVISDNGFVLRSAGEGVYSAGGGFVALADVPVTTGGYSTRVVIQKTFSSSTITKIVLTYDYTQGSPFDLDGRQALVANVVGGSDVVLQGDGTPPISGTGKTLTWNGSVTSNELEINIWPSGAKNAAGTDGAATITKVVVSGAGTNPFGGSGGGGGTNEVFINDMVGSINRQGYLAWLSKKTVAGTDYVYLNRTFNSFATKFSTQVAAYDATLNYGIQMGSYNSGSTGLVYVTAGTAGSTGHAWKSTNWGSTFAVTADNLNTSGGIIAVGYAKRGGAANSGSSPEYVLILNNTTNLVARGADGASHTVASGTSHVPDSQLSMASATLDFNYISLITRDGNVYTSSDGGVTWAAATAITGGASFIARGITGWPSNRSFLLCYGYRALTYSANFGSSWTSLWSSYDTWRSANLGSGVAQTIISAFGDLSIAYSRAITQ